MPQPHPPFTYIPPTYIAPITCPHCGAEAYLMRRTPHPTIKGELRTFECKGCHSQNVMAVKD